LLIKEGMFGVLLQQAAMTFNSVLTASQICVEDRYSWDSGILSDMLRDDIQCPESPNSSPWFYRELTPCKKSDILYCIPTVF